MKEMDKNYYNSINKAYSFGQIIPAPFVQEIESKISNFCKNSSADKKAYWEAFQKGFSLAIQERRLEREKRLAQIENKETDRSRNR